MAREHGRRETARRLPRELWVVPVIAALVALGWIIWQTYRRDNLGFGNKNLWDWMELLLVPAALALGGLWFSAMQKATELEIARRQREKEAFTTLDRQRQATLDKYLDSMERLICDRQLAYDSTEAQTNRTRLFATERTLMVLRDLDSRRNQTVVQFLRAMELIVAKDKSDIIELVGADLTGAQLKGVNLDGVCLKGACLEGANLQRASLMDANLENTDFTNADLRGAKLNRAKLRKAKLIGAKLDRAMLADTDLSDAELCGASLFRVLPRHGRLWKLRLTGANLLRADFVGPSFRYYRRLSMYQDDLRAVGHSVLLTDRLGRRMRRLIRMENSWHAGRLYFTSRLLSVIQSGDLVDSVVMPDNVKLRGQDNPNGPTLEQWGGNYSRVPRKTTKRAPDGDTVQEAET